MWWKFPADIFAANLEAQSVIGLRLMALAQGGPAAEIEARLMVTEKMAASAEAIATLATGGSPETIVRRYRTIMRANNKRLGGKSPQRRRPG